ncbi:Eco57I restriction-modification methylase domain-containing protein [Planktothrix agardhii]|uniref:Eco57I restriction-modification methylase domain-containing protein n=1 Tax=Planktothrix agardhii TaxID=1160 RepID=UPI000411407F|nr:DUF559 domain-containing protein [Planktothrix agardhii]
MLLRAKELRQQQTPAEKVLWECLRDRRFCDAKFRRQHNIDRFIADFYCHSAKLVIELDGSVHNSQVDQDQERDAWMRSQGLTVLRFRNQEVFDGLERVLLRIMEFLPSPPAPLPRGEGSKKEESKKEESKKEESKTPSPSSSLSPPSPLGEGGRGDEGRLRHLLSYTDEPHQFTDAEVERLIQALDNCKILDPACGSGAFPMGVLQKMVHILSKLDRHNERWKHQQKEREILPVLEDLRQAQKISYEQAREAAVRQLEERLGQIEDDFASNEKDYPRKLFLIENCIYGVDIQPIALQIAKLRCFISLIVEQKVDNNQANRGILPLPNLETKFVAANSLIRFNDQMSLRSPAVQEREKELKEVRQKHFTARSKATKDKYRNRDQELRNAIGDLLKATGLEMALADSLATWNPYNQNTSADFFDPEWMFGIADGFDIVIGNPPYVRQEQIKEFKPILQKQFDCYTGVADLFVYFFERGYQLLNTGGVLSYICSNKYFRSGYGEKLRDFLGKNTTIQQLIDFGDTDVFTAIAYPSIILFSKEKASKDAQLKALSWQQTEDLKDFPSVFDAQNFLMPQSALKADGWRLENTQVLDLLAKLRNAGKPLGEYVNGKFYRGILTGFNEAFVIDRATRDKLIAEHSSSAEVIKPLLRGRDVKRWRVDYQDLWLIFTRRGTDIKKYPAIEKHLGQYRNRLTAGVEGGRKAGSYQWYDIQDNVAYWQEFEQIQIVWGNLATSPQFAIASSGFYICAPANLIVSEHEKYFLLAILNSQITQYIVSQNAAVRQGGFLEFKPMYVSQIPIPTATEAEQKAIEILVQKCLDAKGQNVGQWEQEIDEIVARLYGLSDEDMQIIRGNTD